MPSRGAVLTGAQPPLMTVLDMVDGPHQAYQRQAEAFVRGSMLEVLRIMRRVVALPAPGEAVNRRPSFA